jgi:ABC-type dipeptide/oligopeptide/nickel transport system permease component
MGYFLVRRLFWALFLFLVATLVTYLIFFVIPGDPVPIAAGSGATATPAFLAHVRHVLHLDLPIYQQYWLFVWNMIRHASLGYSFRNGTSVRWIVGQDAPVTAALVFGGAVLWLAVRFRSGSSRPCGRGRSSTAPRWASSWSASRRRRSGSA